ncbi:uncharacterized protein N7459_004015 [Penicillium hispanicum]|uniref:uncharacterized protein n=1 Tax=Penicillium hispanicum TaxID=1080232 RepID=UPI002541B3E4|nr:uncharacterized protein N7459_004015 [Penicillium hispanicum]KAJ5584215.1 hypothetical protein N7459_004015 [Penicillium hispanicum]
MNVPKFETDRWFTTQLLMKWGRGHTLDIANPALRGIISLEDREKLRELKSDQSSPAQMAETLNKLIPIINQWKDMAEELQKDGYAGRCIRLKCDVIQATVYHVSQRLRDREELDLYASQVLAMLALHIGCLTMYLDVTRDEFAMDVANIVDAENTDWRRDYANPPGQKYKEEQPRHIWHELYSIWTHLYFGTPFCECSLCYQRCFHTFMKES